MRILITGGLGTVGRGLHQELQQRGHDVISCDLYHEENEHAFSLKPDVAKPTYVRCDIREYRQIERTMNELGPFDAVYNCAAEFGRWNGEDFYENLWQTNVIGMKHILRLQERLNFRLIHFSSSEVYGDWQDVMAEDVMDKHEIKQMNDYAMTKWVNEMQIHNAALLRKTESVIVRLFNTYGPGEYYSPYRSVNCRFIYCALMGLAFTVFRGHYRTSTYLSDTVRTCANIVDNFKAGEVYNIGGTALHTIEELADLIVKLSGADSKLVQYRESEPMTTKIKRVDTTKARHDLGHVDSVGLEEGLRLTIDWMKKAYQVI